MSRSWQLRRIRYPAVRPLAQHAYTRWISRRLCPGSFSMIMLERSCSIKRHITPARNTPCYTGGLQPPPEQRLRRTFLHPMRSYAFRSISHPITSCSWNTKTTYFLSKGHGYLRFLRVCSNSEDTQTRGLMSLCLLFQQIPRPGNGTRSEQARNDSAPDRKSFKSGVLQEARYIILQTGSWRRESELGRRLIHLVYACWAKGRTARY